MKLLHSEQPAQQSFRKELTGVVCVRLIWHNGQEKKGQECIRHTVKVVL